MKVASTENETNYGQAHMKRKFDALNTPDNEAVGHNDTMKKARSWNTENLKGSKQQNNLAAVASPKSLSEPFSKCTGMESGVYEGTPKERIDSARTSSQNGHCYQLLDGSHQNPLLCFYMRNMMLSG